MKIRFPLGLLLAAVALAQAAPPPPPNILYIMADDHAQQAISAYGSQLNQTPQIDRIARDGALFLNSFCANSICGPSRACVLTGQHSHRNGMFSHHTTFNLDQPTLPKYLQAAGYQTAVIGKWHLGNRATGFDHWMILDGQGSYYNPDFLTATGRVRVAGYATELIADLSLDWLKNGRDPSKPFFLMCHHKAPHRNWAPGPNQLSLYRGQAFPEPTTLFDTYANRDPSLASNEMSIAHHLRPREDLKLDGFIPEAGRMTPEQQAAWTAAYAAENAAFAANPPTGEARVRWNYQRYISDYLRCVAGVDQAVGRMLDYLDASGLASNTLVIYASDQSFYLGEHGWFDKRWMFEESMRMPLLMRWPGHIAPGTRIKPMVQNIDYAPTFLAAAGQPVPKEMQGISLLPLLGGKRPRGWRDTLYYHYYEDPGEHRVPEHDGIRTEHYKLIHFVRSNTWNLFDLVKDPLELRSVYDDPAYATERAILEMRYGQVRAQYEAPEVPTSRTGDALP